MWERRNCSNGRKRSKSDQTTVGNEWCFVKLEKDEANSSQSNQIRTGQNSHDWRNTGNYRSIWSKRLVFISSGILYSAIQVKTSGLNILIVDESCGLASICIFVCIWSGSNRDSSIVYPFVVNARLQDSSVFHPLHKNAQPENSCDILRLDIGTIWNISIQFVDLCLNCMWLFKKWIYSHRITCPQQKCQAILRRDGYGCFKNKIRPWVEKLELRLGERAVLTLEMRHDRSEPCSIFIRSLRMYMGIYWFWMMNVGVDLLYIFTKDFPTTTIATKKI